MARETWVQSQVESYQRLKKWYLMPPCLTLSIIRYGSRIKWSNPGKGVAPFPTPWCSKLSKREPSGHPRLKGDNFTYSILFSTMKHTWNKKNTILILVELFAVARITCTLKQPVVFCLSAFFHFHPVVYWNGKIHKITSYFCNVI